MSQLNKDWKRDTRRVRDGHRSRGEAMSFVLPVDEPTKCSECDVLIKRKTECLHELEADKDFNGKISVFCDDLCWITWWNRKDLI